MNKFQLALIGSIFCLLVAYFAISPDHSSKISEIPRPAENLLFNNEAKKKYKTDKKKYFEYLHHAGDSSLDYNSINTKFRRDKAEKRISRQAFLLKNGILPPPGQAETFANSTLTATWTERGSRNQSGRNLFVDYNQQNQILLIASQGGTVWKGTLEGNDYQPLNDVIQFDFSGLMSFNSPDSNYRILVVDRQNVYYTDNNGITWQTADGLSGTLLHGLHLGANDSLAFVVNSWGDVFKSSDRGAIYTNIGRVSNASSATRFWVGEEGSVYLANGYNLHQVSPDYSHILSTSQVGQTKGVTYVGIGGDRQNGIPLFMYYQYSDNSLELYGFNQAIYQWELKPTPPTALFTSHSFEVSQMNLQTLFAGQIEVHKSTDGGQTWSLLNQWQDYYDNPESLLHADIPQIYYTRDQDSNWILLTSTDGGTYISRDDALTNLNITLTGIRNSQYYSTYTHYDKTNIIFAGSQDQGAQLSTENQEESIFNFNQVIGGDFSDLVSGDSGKSIWFEYPNMEIWYLPNSEDTKLQWPGDSPKDNMFWLPPTLADPDTPTVIYAGGTHLHRFHTTNPTSQGNFIKFDQMSYNFGTKLTALAHSPNNHNKWYAAGDGGKFFRSEDRGQNWVPTAVNGLPLPHYFNGQTILHHPTNEDEIYICGNGYQNYSVYVTKDSGESFQKLGQGLPNTLVHDIDISRDGKYLFAASVIGPYLYVFAEEQWYDISGSSAPDQEYWSVEWVEKINTARFSTYGRGIWDFTISQEPIPLLQIPGTILASKLFNSSSLEINQFQPNSVVITEKDTLLYLIDGSLSPRWNLELMYSQETPSDIEVWINDSNLSNIIVQADGSYKINNLHFSDTDTITMKIIIEHDNASNPASYVQLDSLIFEEYTGGSSDSASSMLHLSSSILISSSEDFLSSSLLSSSEISSSSSFAEPSSSEESSSSEMESSSSEPAQITFLDFNSNTAYFQRLISVYDTEFIHSIPANAQHIQLISLDGQTHDFYSIANMKEYIQNQSGTYILKFSISN